MKPPRATAHCVSHKQYKTQSTTHKFFILAAVLNAHIGLSTLVNDFKREVLEIRLHFGIIELAADKTFRVENTSGDPSQMVK